ncbi:hypothetical protein D9619_002288 [Psilocybe cf. subviscida]|uniref:Uncharacterized protein n=1 Tax=Psilocybe cf. subviscida TaxID=2480587 RepID=A0A8H5BEK0_9AGAR|nr:hypothetical protein D9619_002288 [Psilocybe cf. subviscida]
MTLRPTNQQRMGSYGRVPECHMFSGARNTVLYPGTIILLSDEDRGRRTPMQTAFENAEDITIYGGFYGTDANKALEHARLGLQPYGGLDVALRREEAALRREELALRHQSELEKRKFQRGIAPPAAPQSFNPLDYRSRDVATPALWRHNTNSYGNRPAAVYFPVTDSTQSNGNRHTSTSSTPSRPAQSTSGNKGTIPLFMSANSQNDRAGENRNASSQRHLYPEAKNTVVYPGTIILLSGNDAAHETLFRDASDTRMFGGFCASGEPRIALEYAQSFEAMSVADVLKLEEIQLQREKVALEREKLKYLNRASGAGTASDEGLGSSHGGGQYRQSETHHRTNPSNGAGPTNTGGTASNWSPANEEYRIASGIAKTQL